MRAHVLRRRLFRALHAGLLGCFLLFALFPLFWLLKVSLTPNDLLYSEGVRLWPSRITFEAAWELRPPEVGAGFALVGVGGDELTATGEVIWSGSGTGISC